jgi:ABC-type Zn uptake system ZnuABC Zn-binding protein ZnuA
VDDLPEDHAAIIATASHWKRESFSLFSAAVSLRGPLLLLLVAALAAGCGSDEPDGGEMGVLATTTHVADLVANVGGERVDVERVLEPGADPHGYEPRPSDAAAAAKAAVVFRSGGEPDAWLDDLLENAGADTPVVDLIGSVRTIDDDAGDTDPHWWQDPRNAIAAVNAIRDALVRADPDGRAGYERRARAYGRRLRALDREIARCMARVPVDERKLVTTHDSLAYFADRYDIEVLGSVLPSLSTQAQPSARDIDRLVQQVEDEGVRAVFPESGASERLERALAREAGAEVGAPLFSDSLGDEGSGGEIYIDALEANANALAEGMSGGRVSC